MDAENMQSESSQTPRPADPVICAIPFMSFRLRMETAQVHGHGKPMSGPSGWGRGWEEKANECRVLGVGGGD